MSWVKMLYDTYENHQSEIGKLEIDEDGKEQAVLMPICHTTANFHVEITLDARGKVIPNSRKILTDKKTCVTVLPCSETSQSRSGSNPKNHPLFDKIQYLAGDYTAMGGKKGSHFHENYMDDLREWCESPHAHPRVTILYEYLKKGTMIADLIEEGIIPRDENGQIIRAWKKEYGEKRGVYQAGSALNDCFEAMIRINVTNLSPEQQPELWKDREVWQSFINFYLSKQEETDLCYVQGKQIPCSAMSPSKIRHAADKGKLISANDSSGFTYRGRFVTDGQATKIGYETTQKAHNALKWLLETQGFHHGDLYYVIWGCGNQTLPPIEEDFFLFEEEELPPSLHTEYAQKLSLYMAGYRSQWKERENVMILGLDSATTGRLSLVHYQEVEGNEYLERLQRWYESFSWVQIAFKERKSYYRVFTPIPRDMIDAMYGSSASDKLKKSTMQRILHCILQDSPIPLDFVRKVTERVSKPTALETWEYKKYLPIACAVIRKYYNKNKEIYQMGLDENNMERDYLFGRVLAYFHYIEEKAMYLKAKGDYSEKRITNAMRLKYLYSRYPAKTREMLEKKVDPYLEYLIVHTKSGEYLESELRKVSAKILREDYTDKKLSPIFLLGYDCQLVELKKSKGEKEHDITK